jgi:hypothetical protein
MAVHAAMRRYEERGKAGMRRTGPAAAAAILISVVACGGGPASNAPEASTPAASQPVSLDPRPSPTLSPSAAPTASPSPTLLTEADDVTMVVSNRYPYRIWIPIDWVTGEMGAADAFQGPAGQQVDVRHYPAIEDASDAWFGKAREVLEGFAPIDAEGSTVHPAGTSRSFELHPTSNGQKLVLYRLVLVSGTDAWDITWVSPAGEEATDQRLFQSITNTFWPTSEPLNVWSLAVGDCFQSLPISELGRAGTSGVFIGPVDGFARVECSAAHAGEVIATLPDLEEECDPLFEPYIGRSLDGSAFGLLKFVPLLEADLPAGSAGLCVVADESGSSMGTARGSAG